MADDEPIIAMDLAEELEAAGAVVVGPAGTLERAAALIATKKIDAALLDVKLGEQMVYPIADALIAQGVPFIFITGCDVDTISERYARIPRYEKPFLSKSVIDALKQAAPGTGIVGCPL
ncbi:MAG: response regulator [Sphingomonadales bacterium]|nr:response regulator [Sphingomonadales bacterium]